MRNITILLILMLLISQGVNSQTIKDFEHALSWSSEGDDSWGKVDTAYMLLKLDPVNESAVSYIVQYYFDREIDSVSIFYERLIANNPQKPEPYLYRANDIFFEFPSISDSCNSDSLWALKKEYYLLKALELDSNNFFTNYALSNLYYSDFLKPTIVIPNWYDATIKDDLLEVDTCDRCLNERQRISKKTIFSSSATKALYFLKRLQSISNDSNYLYFFSIKQLEKFLYNINPPPLDSLVNKNRTRLPSWFFATLKSNWESDLSVNYLISIDWSNTSVENFHECLDYFKDANLYHKGIAKSNEIYRAIWLRSFDMPILFRIEKEEETVWMFWKFPVDTTYKNVVTQSRQLTKKEWAKFLKLFKATKFENRPNEKYTPMLDGSVWILERKTFNSYKAHKNNLPDEKLKKCLLYMLELSGIVIDKNRIY